MTNKEYEIKRNALIRLAEAYADRQVGVRPKVIGMPWHDEIERREWGDRWNRAFHSRMNELAKEAGLI